MAICGADLAKFVIPPAKTLTISDSINHISVLFRNLLDNAIKFTLKNGEITWTIEEVPAGVQHTITDTSHGIESEHLPHLFERFFRVDKARSRAVPGTGLGLALAKSIVEAYAGTIKIASHGLDKGTKVTVILPPMPSA